MTNGFQELIIRAAMENQNQKEKNIEEISWRAPEYSYTVKGNYWYAITIVIAFILLIIALTQKNFFFAIFIILAEVMLIFFAKKRPQIIDFEINDTGIAIGKNSFYEYDNLEGFSIDSHPPRLDEIILKKKTAVNPYIKIPIDSKLAIQAKEILAQKLPEIEYQASIIDILANWLGF